MSGLRLDFRYPPRSTKLRVLAPTVKAWRTALRGFSGSPLLYDSGLPTTEFLADWKGPTFPLAPGELSKSWQELERVLSFLVSHRVERKTPLVVIGGGSACDVGSLAASLYRRGMPLVLVPTTLLSMVDASVGGKSAIDYREGPQFLKNFAGTFYPADEVLLYSPFLKSLPQRERLSGIGELVKMIWIAGEEVPFQIIREFLESANADKHFFRIVLAAVEKKIQIVRKDPLDQKRIREILNFGHTVGHVLESGSRGELSHGEAVLLGMAIEVFALLKKSSMQRELRKGLEILQEFSDVGRILKKLKDGRVEWELLLYADKKIRSGKLDVTLLSAPGKVVRKSVPPEVIVKGITTFLESYRLGEVGLLM